MKPSQVATVKLEMFRQALYNEFRDVPDIHERVQKAYEASVPRVKEHLTAIFGQEEAKAAIEAMNTEFKPLSRAGRQI